MGKVFIENEGSVSLTGGRKGATEYGGVKTPIKVIIKIAGGSPGQVK